MTPQNRPYDKQNVTGPTNSSCQATADCLPEPYRQALMSK
jgi:hypothetical protein